MRRHFVVVLMALLLVGAGCQGLTGERQTVTPVSVPSATGEPTENSDRLVERHERAVTNQSHTTTVTLTITYPNGSVGQRTDQFRVGADDNFRYERRTTGPYPSDVTNLSLWANGSHEFRRENGTVTVSDSTSVTDTTAAPFLRRLLGTFDLTATETTAGYRLTGSEENAGRISLPTVLVDHRNATVAAEVREDVIRNVTIDLTADDSTVDQTVEARYVITVEDVGTTTPTRPVWAERSDS